MYTTRPLSVFKDHPEEASRPLPEGPNSGQLVLRSAADEGTWFFGLLTDRRVRQLPFPQNCVLEVRHTKAEIRDVDQTSGTVISTTSVEQEAVVFVPVPGLPLASNRYYAVIAEGPRKGLVRACSREEDMATCCCCCRRIRDVEPRPFDPADVYQQMEVVRRWRGRFTTRAVAADGLPPSLYRKEHWEVYASYSFDLGEAAGLDAALRSRQLAGALPVVAAPAVVGRWYCPFFLVREHGVAPREQMESSAFYEVALEQRWEPMRGGAVRLAHDRSKLAAGKALIGGNVEAAGTWRHGDAYVWFASETGEKVGVCTSVMVEMLREQGRGGWVNEEEEAGDMAGGMVMVERFVVRRMDRSVVVAFDFVNHNRQRYVETSA